MTVLYATTADLKEVLGSTDAGTGTAAQLSNAQLTLALQAGSNRVSIFAGAVYDSSSAGATPPAVFHDLALDLAAFYATTFYLKQKNMGADHPVRLRYNDAMLILNDVRDGKVRLDVTQPGGVITAGGTIINRIPRIFTMDDSDTRYDPGTGTLAADTTPDTLSRGILGDFGSGYLG